MAAVPVIAFVVAVGRALVALGVGIAGGAAGEAAVKEARKRQEAADKAKSTPIARTEAQTKTKPKKCDKCPPDCGADYRRNTSGWSDATVAYQFKICGRPFGSGYIMEWEFAGITFDGFDSSQCLLLEAKAKYDQFFSDFGQPLKWWSENVDVMFNEAGRQSAVARPRPPVRLKWHFMESVSYRYFSRIIVAAYPDVEVVYQP